MYIEDSDRDREEELAEISGEAEYAGHQFKSTPKKGKIEKWWNKGGKNFKLKFACPGVQGTGNKSNIRLVLNRTALTDGFEIDPPVGDTISVVYVDLIRVDIFETCSKRKKDNTRKNRRNYPSR